MSDRTRIPADTVRTFIAAVLQKMNVPEDAALAAADVLVEADLRGVETHGFNNLPMYMRAFREGRINPTPTITRPVETPFNAVVDGDGGLGLVVGVQAMDLAIEKAKVTGIGVVTVRRSNHYGMAAYHAMRCLPHDMIGISLTNNSGTGIVPTYGLESMFSTNPISMAVPVGEDIPWVLDMATSVVAYGKIQVAMLKGEPIPLGWAMNKDGELIDDPTLAMQSALALPLGSTPEGSSHKGYGLAVLVDILSGVLGGGVYGNRQARNPSDDEKMRRSSSHFFLALRLDAFRPVDEFKADMDDMLVALRNSKKMPGHDRIYTHGEKEYYAAQDRQANGIPYHPVYIQQMRDYSVEFGIPFELGVGS